MGMSAAKSDKSTKAEASKDGARVRSAVENSRETELDPLRALVQGRECRSCGTSVELVAQRMAALPGAQRREAAMALQRSRGNRFVQRMAAIQAKMLGGHCGSKRVGEVAEQPAVLQRQADPELEEDEDEDEILQGKFAPIQSKSEAKEKLMQCSLGSDVMASRPVRAKPEPNRTGMPDRLKAGIESLSGIDMSDVRVHANSDRPARLNALAYTQGNQIYLGPGQERHLPHEAWHAVQQKQGRVRATEQMKGVQVNDDAGLEEEADRMGGNALRRDLPVIARDRGNGLSTYGGRQKGAEHFFPPSFGTIAHTPVASVQEMRQKPKRRWTPEQRAQSERFWEKKRAKDLLREEADKRLISKERSELTQIVKSDEDFFIHYLHSKKDAIIVYRGEGRNINKDSLNNFQRVDITPKKGTRDISFYGATEHSITNTIPNGFISTTKDKDIAIGFATDSHQFGLVYEIKIDDYIDVNALLKARNFKIRYENQYEVLIPRNIKSSEVQYVTLFNKKDEIGKFSP